MESHKILVVDDEKDNIDLLRMALANDSCQVIGYLDAQEAWEAIESDHKSIDIVFLDLMMPGLDGMTLLKMIKANKDFSSLKVIIQSAKYSQRAQDEAKNHGAEHYLTKPYSKDEVREVVERCFSI